MHFYAVCYAFLALKKNQTLKSLPCAEWLKELFQNTPYDDLLNLQFVIEKPTKPKRKYVKKKVKVEEEVKQEEVVVNTEELYPEKIKENETSVE